jgi:hypothetical protein
MSPHMNVSIVRPLTDRLYDPEDTSMGEFYISLQIKIFR